MNATYAPAPAAPRATNPRVGPPIIIATDGHARPDSAVAIGRLLAEQSGLPGIATVIKPLPAQTESPLAASHRAEGCREVNRQLRRLGGPGQHVEVRAGDPATVLAQIARNMSAKLIVAGLGGPRATDRLFGSETALRLARLADVPVYAVASGAREVPRHILVGVDFSESSLRAARLAVEFAPPGAIIDLVHVAPGDGAFDDWKGWGASHRQGAERALQRMLEQMAVPKDGQVRTKVLHGDPAAILLANATSIGADLIALGSHGHSFVSPLLLGVVTTRVLSESACSVLTVPHAELAAE